MERLSLIQLFHENIDDALELGGSRATASTAIDVLRKFYAFADRTEQSLTIETAKVVFLAFADELFARTLGSRGTRTPGQNNGLRPLKMESAYSQGSAISTRLDEILERQIPLIKSTRLRNPKRAKSAQGVQAEKQNLKNTFDFGHLLQDLCDGLSLDNIGNNSLELPLRNGTSISIGDTHRKQLTSINFGGGISAVGHAIVNIRIESELLMFIGQTGLNVEEAHNLKLRHFSYVSHLDGYQVKDRKNRRAGNVLFEIYRDYKEHFERYLRWRKVLFPASDRLFPFIRMEGTRENSKFQGHRLRRLCEQLGQTYVCPQALRGTRVNWLLRESGNRDQTAEMSQHTLETLSRDYEVPSLHRAMVQATRFWGRMDPSNGRTIPIAPGDCLGRAAAISGRPANTPKPNCVNASGCMWCESHRDSDTPMYVWALHSFLHLKIIEESKSKLTKIANPLSPNFKVLNRIRQKIAWFNSSNATRKSWVVEAEYRILNDDFHPDWRGIILEMQGHAQ